jgi:3-methyladenine DNA glycosylase AlkC
MIDFSTFNQIMSREVSKGTKDKFVRKQVASKVDTTACVSALFLQKGHFA